jgi:hypothetical protein
VKEIQQATPPDSKYDVQLRAGPDEKLSSIANNLESTTKSAGENYVTEVTSDIPAKELASEPPTLDIENKTHVSGNIC